DRPIGRTKRDDNRAAGGRLLRRLVALAKRKQRPRQVEVGAARQCFPIGISRLDRNKTVTLGYCRAKFIYAAFGLPSRREKNAKRLVGRDQFLAELNVRCAAREGRIEQRVLALANRDGGVETPKRPLGIRQPRENGGH